MPIEPRFLIIDLHKNKAVPATTDEMQALLWREELTGEEESMANLKGFFWPIFLIPSAYRLFKNI